MHTPLGEPTGLVPSGVHLEMGHRYGMHTSPGGRWCHCGTCPLHSQLVSTAQIYLHSLLFSSELNWKQQRIALCRLEVHLMEFVIAGNPVVSLFLNLRNNVTTLPFNIVRLLERYFCHQRLENVSVSLELLQKKYCRSACKRQQQCSVQ